jgi:Amidase
MTTLPDMTVDDGLMHQASPSSDSFGAVRNPYDPTHIPGGSCGGSGAILVARIVPAALGTDANGTIRCPSAFCGVTGLRHSTFAIENAIRGTNRKACPDEGLLPPPLDRVYTIGPMARTATDVAFQRYAEVYRTAFQPSRFRRSRSSQCPFVTVGLRNLSAKSSRFNGRQTEEGKMLMRNSFIASRLGAAALSVPVGLAPGLAGGYRARWAGRVTTASSWGWVRLPRWLSGEFLHQGSMIEWFPLDSVSTKRLVSHSIRTVACVDKTPQETV